MGIIVKYTQVYPRILHLFSSDLFIPKKKEVLAIYIVVRIIVLVVLFAVISTAL